MAETALKTTNGRIVTPELQQAHAAVTEGKHGLVLGSGGTGKSEFLNEVRRISDRSLAVVAFMGRAALNVEGQTIHSFFRFSTHYIDTAQHRRTYRPPLVLQSLQLLIIDEISMVRADLLDAIDVALRIAKGRLEIPFGGVQVLVLGDHFQLAPIVKDEERGNFTASDDSYASPWFFDAKVFCDTDFEVVEFTRVFRQTNADFIAVLDRLRRGHFTDDDLHDLNAAHLGKRLPEHTVTLVPYRDTTKTLNEKRLAALPGRSVAYEAEVVGKWNTPPVDQRIELKVGARVMCTVNRPVDPHETPRRYVHVNGTLGVVMQLSESSVDVLTDDGQEIRVDPYTWRADVYALTGPPGRSFPARARASSRNCR